jgi:hypothetical protein
MFRPQILARLVLAAIVAAFAAAPLAPVPAASARPAAAGGAAPVCPVAEGNARFVRFSYLEILDRCPDGRGLAFWTAQLDGGLRRSRFTDIIDMSAENLVHNNVVPLYQFLLGRVPTAAELEAGVADIRARRANDAITARLIASDEGYERQVPGTTPAIDDAAWLEWAYARILDRAPDPQGAAYFLGRFSPSGSTQAQRYGVAMDLERSASNARSWVKASMTEALGRTPDPAGVVFWMDWLMGRGRWQTFRMWTLHLASDEAYRRAQTQPS